MTTREECDEAFKLIGYKKFKRRTSSEVYEKVLETENTLEHVSDFTMILSTEEKFCISDKQKLQLINAQRCNNICLDSDTKHLCKEKLQIAFDRVSSVELYNVFPDLCLYLMKCIHPTSEIILEPVDSSTFWYQKILKHTHFEVTFNDLIFKFGFRIYSKILFPEKVHHRNVKYLVNFNILCQIKKFF